ncbi:hypothetical protein LCGC14_2097070, partial [marine sediment metagenome]
MQIEFLASGWIKELNEMEDWLKTRTVSMKVKKDGKEPAWGVEGYYSTLHNALKSLADKEILFQPHPGPQTDFLAASEREVFYGGARGGGKSYALLVDPLRFCGEAYHTGLLLRKTMPELRDLIEHSKKLYPKAYPGAKWREQDKEWRFPSG